MILRRPRSTRTDTRLPYTTLCRSPDQHCVEPAAAALAAGDGAELVTAFAQPLANRVVQFGGEGAGADAGRIGLGDAQHEADRGGAKARPAGCGSGDGVDRKSPRLNSSH